MRLRSLRHKIFAFVLVLLVVGAGLVMLVTERDVTHTLTTSEERAVDNVLNLLARDSQARWASLLGQKASTARQARQPLIQYGSIIESVLDLHARQVRAGLIDEDTARLRAVSWVDTLDLGDQRRAVILDPQLTVLADTRQRIVGHTLSEMRDIKGRRFDQIAYRELGTGDYNFVIYRETDAAGQETPDLYYAAWTRFGPWNWIIAVSDSAQHIVDQFEAQRASMEAAVTETLASIRLAGSGFVFIVDAALRAVTPLPPAHADFLDLRAAEAQKGHTLATLLAEAQHAEQDLRLLLAPRAGSDGDTGRWMVKTATIKPLKWTIVAAVPARELALPATTLRNRLGLIFLAGLLAALAVAWLLAARITRPLQQLGDFARHLPERDLTRNPGLPQDIAALPRRYGDEVGDLAAAFIHMDAELRDKVATLLHETSRRERYESELNIARDIQRGLLPESQPEAIRGRLDLYAHMTPAKEVGGDLYDYFMLPDGRLCLAIGDVSDKGVPAALFMAVTRTLLRSCAEEARDPATLMAQVNARLALNNPNLMFVTLIIGMLDLHSGTLCWANGGHPPPCLRLPGQPLQLLEGRSGPACGVDENAAYRGFSVSLPPGATLIGYTDGISEAMNAHQAAFGDARTLATLAATLDTASAHEVVDALTGAVADFVGTHEQSDDITVLILRRMESS